MPVKRRKRRVPKLCHTKLRGIGYYVGFRDAETGMPRKVRFGNIGLGEAQQKYHAWLGDFLRTDQAVPSIIKGRTEQVPMPTAATNAKVVPGSLLHVTSSFIRHEEARTRAKGEPDRPGAITWHTRDLRKKHAIDFMTFLNGTYGKGAVGRMMLADLAMKDVEEFNAALVKAKYSANNINKLMQVVKAIIDRAGRPEHGGQILSWNWDSRDVLHGRPPKGRVLPTVAQLEEVIAKSEVRERAIIWLGIGLGFGQKDLADLHVGQIDAEGYDLRRSKTGLDRYGETPPGVWKAVSDYLAIEPRKAGQLMFTTAKGMPVTHDGGSAIVQWWSKLRLKLKKENQKLDGFYVLRHLGATEFGSRPGCSISDMRRWLGHAISSKVADLYMKPISPEYREVVLWVRERLLTAAGEK